MYWLKILLKLYTDSAADFKCTVNVAIKTAFSLHALLYGIALILFT